MSEPAPRCGAVMRYEGRICCRPEGHRGSHGSREFIAGRQAKAMQWKRVHAQLNRDRAREYRQDNLERVRARRREPVVRFQHNLRRCARRALSILNEGVIEDA